MPEDRMDEGQLFDAFGQRKYLHAREAKRLLAAAAQVDRATCLFCELLFYTGCRISEGLALTPRLLDADGGRIVFRTLKRRKRVYRAVPVPTRLLHELQAFSAALGPDARLFPWCRQTAWRRIKALMQQASVKGPQATAKGLRHQFGIHALGSKVPESYVQRWMGHARLRNTHIYLFATGPEERTVAERMWREP